MDTGESAIIPCEGDRRIAMKTLGRKLGELGPYPSDEAVKSVQQEFGTKVALGGSIVDNSLKLCFGVYHRELAKALKQGKFDATKVNDYIRGVIPYAVDQKNCSNSRDALKLFADNLVKEGIYEADYEWQENWEEVSNRAREGTLLSDDDFMKCRKTWKGMYKVAFKEAGLYHGMKKDWFDSYVGIEQSSLNTSSSEEVEATTAAF